jgi:putative ABC transport system substrate-binding protein
MKRRDFMLAAVAAVLAASRASHALAQGGRRGTRARIAILDDAPEGTRARLWAAFRARLRELGYTENRDIVVTAVFAGGEPDRLPALAQEVLAARPDVIVAVTTTVASVVKNATSTVPIVALGPADPVRSGLVASLARPGGNLTGLSPNQGEIAAKWLELLRTLVPNAKTFVYLTDTGNPGEMIVFRDLEERGRSLGLQALVLDGVNAANVERAFAAMRARRPDALVVATTSALVPHRARIVEGAERLRLPAIYARAEYPEAGGLISYGADTQAVFAQAADYVHRILQGTPPSELPFQLASTFRLVLNLRTARALGLAVPESLRLRADEVIE